MALNRSLLRSALNPRSAARPATAQEAIAAFGGGAKGRSALAQEIAGTTDKKSVAYKNAMRNIQRYTTAEGKQRRTPKRLTPRITRAVQQQREKRAAQRIKGPITVIWQHPEIRISDDVRDRPDIEEAIPEEMLSDFLEAVAEGNEREALQALAEATLEVWGEGRLGDAEILSAAGLVIERQ